MFAYMENKDQIVDLLENYGFLVGAMNVQSQNLLHLAAIYKRKEAFFNGLKKKVDHNLQDNFGNTPLHYAARNAEVQFV